jgi:predicted dehydrogenase
VIDTTHTTIAIAGSGDDAGQASRALRGVDGVEVTRISGASEEELLEQLSRGDLDAIAFVTPAPDLAGSLRRTLMANRHAMVIGPAALSAKQLLSLDELARRRSRVVCFDSGYEGDERVAFVRKMTASPGALWRPRYVRATRASTDDRGIDELALAEIACVLSIMGAQPSRVSAVAARIDDETGHAGAMMLTMTFDGGPVATVDVSVIEPMPRREIVVACEGRTMVLDAFDARTPLQIQAAGRHGGPQAGHAWSETVTEYPAPASRDRLAVSAEAFVRAVRARDLEAVNLREMAHAALVLETARESIARGGEMLDVAPDVARRPELQVIRGGGKREGGGAPPELTLVRGQR